MALASAEHGWLAMARITASFVRSPSVIPAEVMFRDLSDYYANHGSRSRSNQYG